MNKLFTKIAGLSLGLAMAIGVGVAVGSKEAVRTDAAAGDKVSFVYTTSSSKKFNTAYGANTLADDSISGLSVSCTTAKTKGSGVIQDTYNTSFGGQQMTTNANRDTTVTFTFGNPWSGTHATYKEYTQINSVTFTAVAGSSTTYNVTCTIDGVAATGDNSGFSASKTTTTFTPASGHKKGVIVITVAYSSGKKGWYFDKLGINAEVPSSEDTTTALSVSPNSWSGYDSETLNVSSFIVSCTTSASDAGYVFQGIGSGSDGSFVARDANFSSGHPTTTDTRLQWKAKYPTTAGGSTYLYAYVSLTVTADSVNSIAISGSMTKTTYSQGDAWDPAGFTVKAYYLSAPSTPVDVTNNAGLSWTYSPATTASTSTTSVTCTASFGGKTATSSAQTVTINEKTNLGGLTEGRFFLIVGGHVLKAGTFAAKGADAYTTADDSVDGLAESDAWYFAPTGIDDTWTIRVSDANDADYLYATNANNGLVSGGTSDSWTVEEGTGTYDGKLVMKDTTNSRYISYTTSSGSYIRVYTSDTGNKEVSFVPYEEPVTLDSLTISGATSTFTAGDYFSLGSPTITATYSTGDHESIAANDSGLSFKLGGNAITTSTRLTSSDNGKSLVVRYTDSENRYADATGYTLTVNPKPVQSVTLDKASATITKGGTVDLTATVSDEYAIQTVKWTTSDSSIVTVSAATSTSGNAITVKGSSSNTGSATITAYVDENDNGSLDSGEKSAKCAITVSGDPVLNMLDDEENIISGESLYAFTTDSNIYLHVDAENFVGAITYSWSSSNTNAIAIVKEADEMCEFDIVGAGTNVRLSCHAVGATSGNLTTYVDYTITEPQVDEVTWSAPATLSVYDNASLTAANITSWSPAYHKDNGESGSISSEYTVKLGGTTISLSHPWDVEDDGEELWIEYGGIASSHVTVQVTEHLNPISYSSWQRVTSISAGDTIVLGNAAKGEFMTSTGPATGTLGVVSGTITDGVCTDLPSSAVKFTVGGSSGAWTLQDESGNYLSVSTTAKTSLYLQEESATVAISFSETSAVFGDSSGYRIVLNASASPHRFSTYNSTLSASMVLPEIYKSTTSDIADTNATAQRALLSYVATFNSTMSCNEGGDTANVESKWSSASSAFTTAMNALDTDDKAVFKRLVANASAVEGGDSLQDMLARYDYIIAKYKLSNDFLHDGADRGAVQYARVTPLNIVVNNGNTVAIIVIISMISITAIGGYFLFRKKKENF